MQAVRQTVRHYNSSYVICQYRPLFCKRKSINIFQNKLYTGKQCNSSKGLHSQNNIGAGHLNKLKTNFLTANDFHIFYLRPFHEDRETKAVTVWGSVKELKRSPVPALVLGASGLIPFVAAPGYMIISSMFMPSICFAQMAYGATILSFLGGVRWGFSISEESVLRPGWISLGVSVVPSLVAWGGLMMPHPLSLFVVMGGLAGAGYYDMVSWAYPPWFKGLRFILTFVAILSLWTTFMCSYLLKSESNNESKYVNTTE